MLVKPNPLEPALPRPLPAHQPPSHLLLQFPQLAHLRSLTGARLTSATPSCQGAPPHVLLLLLLACLLAPPPSQKCRDPKAAFWVPPCGHLLSVLWGSSLLPLPPQG